MTRQFSLPPWRKVLGFTLYVATALAVCLTLLMLFAGCRWLYLEWSHGLPLSLSLALLGGGTVALLATALLWWLARWVLSRHLPRTLNPALPGHAIRYVVATIGAVFVFGALVLFSLLVDAFLPPALQRIVTVPLGLFFIRGNPALLIGLVVALAAGVHSFRSTLKRYRVKGATAPINT